MPTELSPEAMRSPLRSLTIVFGSGDRDLLLAKLREVANRNRFAIRVSSDPGKPGDVFVQMYRSDIKMIGLIPNELDRLDLTVLRTVRRVPAEAIEHGVSAIRELVGKLPKAQFEQSIFERGDDMSLEPRTGISPVRSARLTHANNAQDQIKRQIAQFADENSYAIRFTQTTPNPQDLAAYLYSESLNIVVDKAFSNEEMGIAIYRAGDRTTSEAAIDSTFDALRKAIEQVPGVSFVPRT